MLRSRRRVLKTFCQFDSLFHTSEAGFQKTRGKFLLKISNKTSLQKKIHMRKVVNFMWVASVTIQTNRNHSAHTCTSTNKFSQATKLFEMYGITLAIIKWNKGKRGKLSLKSLQLRFFKKKISHNKLQSLHSSARTFLSLAILSQRVSLTSPKVMKATQSYSAAILTHFKKYLLNLGLIQNDSSVPES